MELLSHKKWACGWKVLRDVVHIFISALGLVFSHHLPTSIDWKASVFLPLLSYSPIIIFSLKISIFEV